MTNLSYQPQFYGWLGATGYNVIHQTVYELSMRLASYYRENSFPGQKLVIGYDARPFAREIAELVASIMAHNGIKVFFSNRVASTPLLAAALLHKKCLGAVMITGDAHRFSELGIRALRNDGYFLTDNELNIDGPLDNKRDALIDFVSGERYITGIKKGFIELFDPMISYSFFLGQVGELPAQGEQFLVFNPLFGGASFSLDTHLLANQHHGYTMNSSNEFERKNDYHPASHVGSVVEVMHQTAAPHGLLISPDASTFTYVTEKGALSVQETFERIVSSYHAGNDETRFLVHDMYKDTFTDARCVFTTTDEFYAELQNGRYELGLDAMGRFFSSHHGVPDGIFFSYLLYRSFLTHITEREDLNEFKSI